MIWQCGESITFSDQFLICDRRGHHPEERNPNDSDCHFKMVACAQCRQRKVRCQGGPLSCDACTRLGFQCSYSAAPTPGSGNIPATRKRGARACDSCRTQRSRCSGGTPCLRCQQMNATCHYSLSVRQYRADESQRPMSATSLDSSTAQDRHNEAMSAVHSTPGTDNDIVVSPATSASGRLDKCVVMNCTFHVLI